MQKLEQYRLINRRNSSIELLKVVGIILIVISHVVQTLHSNNDYVIANDYILDISMATRNIQQLILTILRYSGVLGNSIFFICSAWFLLDNDKVDKKKILHMLIDVWVISITILIAVYTIRSGNLEIKLIIQQILPTTFENNWYITCYLLFYPLHPFLNWLIKSMEQKTLLKSTLTLLFLYVCVNYVLPGHFFSSRIILWITIYFAIAYMKYYLVDLSSDVRFNILLVGIGFVGNIGIVCLTNFLGLRFEIFSDKLLRWNSNYSPFLLLMAVSMFNVARSIRFENNIVNYISSLSLLIYIFHENLLLRTFYRPQMWDYVYKHFGYEHILIWTFLLVVLVFSFGLITSIIYRNTMEKIVTIICDWLYPILQKIYKKIESTIMRFH